MPWRPPSPCPRCARLGGCVCARTSPRNHGGVSAARRGYGRAYQQARAQLLGLPCVLRLPGCTLVADTAQHTDEGQLVPACAHCNYADGLRRARGGHRLLRNTLSHSGGDRGAIALARPRNSAILGTPERATADVRPRAPQGDGVAR